MDERKNRLNMERIQGVLAQRALAMKRHSNVFLGRSWLWVPLVYSAVCVVLVHQVVKGFNNFYIGGGADPLQEMWFLGWIPFAVTHGLNPFLTTWIRAESGVNLMWNGAMPLLSVLMWPVSAAAGLVVAFNVATILSVVGSAWAAYYAAVRLGSERFPAFIAGLIYGFSPYMVGQLSGHLILVAVFIPPLLLAGLCEGVWRQKTSPYRLGLLIGGLVVAQVLISEEVAATELLMATIGMVVYGVNGGKRLDRKRWQYFGKVLITASSMCVLLLAYPLAIQFFGPWRVHGAVQPPGIYVADFLNFMVPGKAQLLSTYGSQMITAKFTGFPSEWDDYLGMPLMLLLGGLGPRLWRLRGTGRWLLVMVVVSVLLSMGPYLHVGGVQSHVPLPWVVFQNAPVLRNVLPTRLGVYTYLFVGLVVAAYLSAVGRRRERALRYIVVGLALIPLLPKPVAATPVPEKPLALYSSVLRKIRKNVTPTLLMLPLPGSENDAAMFWQAESGYRFRLVGGYAMPGFDDPLLLPLGAVVNAIERGRALPNASRSVWETQAIMNMAGIYWPVFPQRRVVWETRGVMQSGGVSWVVLEGPVAAEKRVVSFISSVVGGGPSKSGETYTWHVVRSRFDKLFAVDVSGNFWQDGWMGKEVVVHTFGDPARIVLTNKWRPSLAPHSRLDVIEGRQAWVLNGPRGAHMVTVCVPPHMTVKLIASRTFVPEQLIHNGDERRLSYQFDIRNSLLPCGRP